MAFAIGNSKGPNSTMAGMPSSTLPSTTKARIDTARNVTCPPGSDPIQDASAWLKPDCVSAQDMPVAAPMISRMAPDKEAVSVSIGSSRRQMPPPR